MLFLFLDWEGIKITIVGWIRMAIMGLISGVYQLVASLYELFLYMTRVKLLSGDNEALVTNIYNRIQVILAVVMVFYVTLEFIKYIVNPDTFDDKEKGGGGLLKRILIVIVLMAFTPTIFGIAYDLQSRVIKSDVIPKILIKDYNSSTTKNEGGEFSSNLLGMFYRPYSETVTVYRNGRPVSTPYTPEGKCGDHRTPQKVVDDNLKSMRETGKMLNATYCIETVGKDLKVGNEVKSRPFLIEMGMGGLLPIAMGLFMCWVLINYCVEAGRVIIQFVFLQVIAPIPILSYIAPNKDGMFNKWLRQCVTTYLDLFIRLFILHIVMLISGLLIDVFVSNSTELFDGFFALPGLEKTLIKMFLLIGILLFAMKAPKMVKELLPGGSNAASGDFGFGGKSAKERFKPLAKPLGAGLGVARAAGRTGASAFRQFMNNRRNGQSLRKAFGQRVFGRDENGKLRFAPRIQRGIQKRRGWNQEINNAENEVKGKQNALESAQTARSNVRNSEVQNAMARQREATNRLGDAHRNLESLNKQRTDLLNGRDPSALAPSERAKLQELDSSIRRAEAVRSGAMNDVKSAGNDLRSARQNSPAWQNYRSALQRLEQAKQTGDQAAIEKAQKDVYKAAKTVENGEKLSALLEKNDELNALKSAGASTDAIEKAKKERDEYAKEFRTDLKETNESKADRKIDEAQKALEVAKENLDATKQTVQTQKEEYEALLRKERHDDFRPAIIKGITDGAVSLVQETYKGLKTKEITDVLPEHMKAQEAIVKKMEAEQAYYDNGGQIGLGATIQRTANNVVRHFGYGTSSERIQSDIKPLENTIAENKTSLTLEEGVSSSVSNLKKAVASAAEKPTKLRNSVDSLNNVDVGDGRVMTVGAGEKAEDVLTRYKTLSKQKQDISDQANKSLGDAQNNLRVKSNAVSSIEERKKKTSDADELAALDIELNQAKAEESKARQEFNAAQTYANLASVEAKDASDMYGAVEKKVFEETQQQLIRAKAEGRSGRDLGINEESLDNETEQLIQSIDNAVGNSKILALLRDVLSRENQHLLTVLNTKAYKGRNAVYKDIKDLDVYIQQIYAQTKVKVSGDEESVRKMKEKAEREKMFDEGASSGSGKK